MTRPNAATHPATTKFGATGSAGEVDRAPHLTFAFALTATLGPPQEIGMIADSRRRFIPVTGGKVTGPRLFGTVLPGGGDWQTIGSDGVTALHAHYAIATQDGVVIEVDNIGVRVATPEITARLSAGEELDPALYYFRTSPRFSVPAGNYEWLRRRVFVASGVRHGMSVEVKVFEVE